MSFSIYRKTRSVRLTVTTPDGERVVVENLRGNEGFYLAFDCTRQMSAEPGSAIVTAHNLPPEVLGVFEAAQASTSGGSDGVMVTMKEQALQTLIDDADLWFGIEPDPTPPITWVQDPPPRQPPLKMTKRRRRRNKAKR